MIGGQWPRYQVFHQSDRNKPHTNAGTVHAPDPELALLNARDVFVRRPECTSLWVVRADQISSCTAEQRSDPEWSAQGGALQDEPVPFLVFAKTSQAAPHEYLGQVSARDPAGAFHNAFQQFSQVGGLVWWVVPDEAVTRMEEGDGESFFEPARDKTYRDQSDYRTQTMLREIREQRRREAGRG